MLNAHFHRPLLNVKENQFGKGFTSGKKVVKSLTNNSKEQGRCANSKPNSTKLSRLEVPRQIKKQVSFDYRTSLDGEIQESCAGISSEGLGFIQKIDEKNKTETTPIRSYQRDLFEYYKSKKENEETGKTGLIRHI